MAKREPKTGRSRGEMAKQAVKLGVVPRRGRRNPAAEPGAADFTAAYVRRALEPRLRGHGCLEVQRARVNGFTIVHRYRSEWNGRDVNLPIAQLRHRCEQIELYWKNTNGRWTRYKDEDGIAFAGSLDACLRAIANDRWGCFWG
jgi:hypothetical protein